METEITEIIWQPFTAHQSQILFRQTKVDSSNKIPFSVWVKILFTSF